jgi:hypothetical protein
MGNRPEIIVAPSALAELSQNITKIGEHFAKQFEPLAKLGEQFAQQLEPLIKAGKKLQLQITKAFSNVKDFFKQILVKYLPFDLPLFEIPRAQIQPSNGKVLQLPNSYHSHSPPICSVIKWSWFKTI